MCHLTGIRNDTFEHLDKADEQFCEPFEVLIRRMKRDLSLHSGASSNQSVQRTQKNHNCGRVKCGRRNRIGLTTNRSEKRFHEGGCDCNPFSKFTF